MFYRKCFTHTQTLFFNFCFILPSFILPSSPNLARNWSTKDRVGDIDATLHTEYFYPCSLDYFLPVHQIFSLCLLQQSNGIWATPRPVSSAVASPWGTARALTFLGNIFFLTGIDFRSFAYQSEV